VFGTVFWAPMKSGYPEFGDELVNKFFEILNGSSAVNNIVNEKKWSVRKIFDPTNA